VRFFSHAKVKPGAAAAPTRIEELVA